MALLEINPDLRRLTAAAERIAFTLEQIALHEYGVAPLQLKRMWTLPPADADDVGYSSDETTLRQELEQLVMPATVQEREGPEVEEEIGDVLRQDRRT
jgi:hypothetical protein